ncbi:MAG: restriction endonuclease subunit S [Candidatus Thiodiazotropha endolucinida]|nr:restriction endonuclease subunit S [Candidatus Thiodiazotropha taylori]MCW4347280.1 restriction endonuclease subunit S [Candidatus Thiodiazotropha endolucinida]
MQGCAEFGAKFPASEKYCLNPPKTAQKGSWLISVRAPVGSLNLADQDYCIGRGLAAVSPGAVDRGYLGYLLLNKSGFLNAISTGSTFQAISTFQLQNLELELPPLTTQQLIAQFLDEKTAQIDGLIEKKRALLDRLAEKRQALITRAVTKGLNPDAPMKPSGIDWLGDIPSHWEVLPLKRAVQYQEGPGIMAVDFRDEGVPLLRVASIGGRYATLNGVNYLEPEMANGKWGHFLTEVGDLLISASATSGIVSEVTEETSGCIPYTGIIRVNPIDGEADSSFLRNLLVSDVFLSQIDQLKAGSTIQHFGPYHLGLMVIAKPPLSEQKAISQVLDNAIEDLDYAEGEVRKSVELLSEYRSALLTSAVTGQIGDLG